MSKKHKGKSNKEMTCLCIKCKDEFRKCDCKYEDTGFWYVMAKKDLKVFRKTGLVPDYKAALYSDNQSPAPEPIEPTFPPKYSFKV